MPDGTVQIRDPAALLAAHGRTLRLTTSADAYTRLLPQADLAILRQVVAESLQAATSDQAMRAVTALAGSFKTANVIDDPKAFMRAMAAELASYPLDVLEAAVREARRALDWLPSIAQMVTICDRLIEPRRNQLHGVKVMQAEADRRAAAAAEAETAEQKKRDEREAFLRRLGDQFGDLAPTGDEIERAGRAWSTRPGQQWGTWFSALDRGEGWAVGIARRLGRLPAAADDTSTEMWRLRRDALDLGFAERVAPRWRVADRMPEVGDYDADGIEW